MKNPGSPEHFGRCTLFIERVRDFHDTGDGEVHARWCGFTDSDDVQNAPLDLRFCVSLIGCLSGWRGCAYLLAPFVALYGVTACGFFRT